jgi:hypothetical protein
VGLWQKLMDALIRRDEPGFNRDEAPDSQVSTVPYATADLGDETGADETVDSQREGEGFR